MTVQLAQPVPAPAPAARCFCCQQAEHGRQTHCPACHHGLHSTPFAFLVVAPPVLVAYFDQEEAETVARESGAVVVALPMIADFRAPSSPPAPVVQGRAQLAAVPPQRAPEEILPVHSSLPAVPEPAHDGYAPGRVVPPDQQPPYDPSDARNGK